ncbi:MAG: TolC family protein [Dysgonamonadaceae bacterium]|jgi:outer membrane protein TolC|nr:TolC family protein [Dysgonamonadaceae bacterium]
MKRKVMISILTFFASISGFAQLTLDDCYAKARANYPLIRQYDLLEQTERYSLANIAKSYLPRVTLNGQASYQSDITALPIDLKSLGIPVDIPTVSNDQYKAAIDVNQLLWDGGQTNSQRTLVKAANEVEKCRTDVSMYAVEEKVCQLFFGILAMNERLKILDLKEKDVLSNKKTVESLLKNGTATQSDLDQINVAQLQIEQTRTEHSETKLAFCRALSLFIREDVHDNTVLVKPTSDFASSGAVFRPELTLFDAQITLLAKQSGAITAKNRPVVSLFAQGGYGRPGLNMLKDEFDFFAIGGLRLTWNFGNLYTQKNERHILQSNINAIALQRETFLFITNLQLTQEQSEIEKSRKLLLKDDEIVTLRECVKQAGESKYRNGIYQMSELIRDINAEEEARQTKALHEIQYLLNIHNYRHTKGLRTKS